MEEQRKWELTRDKSVGPQDIVGPDGLCFLVYGAEAVTAYLNRFEADRAELIEAGQFLLGQFDQAHDALDVERSSSAKEAIQQMTALLARLSPSA